MILYKAAKIQQLQKSVLLLLKEQTAKYTKETLQFQVHSSKTSF